MATHGGCSERQEGDERVCHCGLRWGVLEQRPMCPAKQPRPLVLEAPIKAPKLGHAVAALERHITYTRAKLDKISDDETGGYAAWARYTYPRVIDECTAAIALLKGAGDG